MTLNTFVAGDSASLRELSASLRDYAEAAHEGATGYHRTRSGSEAVWDGQAGDGYRATATHQAQGGDRMADTGHALTAAVEVFAADLDTVKSKMGHAHQAAHDGGLPVLGHLIFPPTLPPAPAPAAPDGGILSDLLGPSPGEQHQAQQQAQAQFARQQAAYEEAQAILHEARQAERAAHERLHAGLNTQDNSLGALPQHAGWEQAAASATSPAAVALAGAATRMDGWASNATRATFEKAMAAGPAAVAGAWRSMTTSQQADLTATHPQLVGSTNGVPATARDTANRSILAQTRSVLVAKLEQARQSTLTKDKTATGSELGKITDLEESLKGLDAIEEQLQDGDKYLLAVDDTANNRGQVAIANGNPDRADHVVTYVPGTGSDLGNATSDLQRNEDLARRAHELAPHERTSTILWGNYESPELLDNATKEHYAEDARADLSHFQEGLRAAHEGGPAHATVLGHSYGSTVVGETGRDYGLHADDVAFVGSPGVGVDHAGQLGVSPDHVYSGTADGDQIDYLTPSGNVWDDAKHAMGWGPDMHWFGRNPSDPSFGGHIMPTDPGGHSEYWDNPRSLDSLARVAVGQAEGMPR